MSTGTNVSPAVLAEIAPTGMLRVGLNMGNFLLTGKDPKTGQPIGIAVDLGTELARRLGVPVEFVGYATPGELADAATFGAWDVGFLGAEPQRAKEIDFTAAYVEIEATYLVPPASTIRDVSEVDRPGVRIAVPEKSAYELYLARTLKNANLMRTKGGDAAFKLFVDEKLEALAGLRPRLVKDHAKLPGSRIIYGRFTAVQQAIGIPRGRVAGAKYLREFVEDIKSSGLVAKTIDRNGIRGLNVAPMAGAS